MVPNVPSSRMRIPYNAMIPRTFDFNVMTTPEEQQLIRRTWVPSLPLLLRCLSSRYSIDIIRSPSYLNAYIIYCAAYPLLTISDHWRTIWTTSSTTNCENFLWPTAALTSGLSSSMAAKLRMLVRSDCKLLRQCFIFELINIQRWICLMSLNWDRVLFFLNQSTKTHLWTMWKLACWAGYS